MPHDPTQPAFVSRGGLKLHAALDAFGLDVDGLACVDLGCSTGGFTDCLLRAGAASVVAVDTAYGELAWSLRNDPRVTVLERTNALHAQPPGRVREAGGVDLAVIDLGWTKQRLAVPAAARWLRPGGRVVSLVKPHYESPRPAGRRPAGRNRGKAAVLSDAEAKAATAAALDELIALGFVVAAVTESPIRGGTRGSGNAEWLALIDPPAAPA